MEYSLQIDHRAGMDLLWRNDARRQTEILEGIIENIRNIHDSELALLSVKDLVRDQMFFVPNDEYMIQYFGDEIKEYKYGIYRQDGICLLTGRLAMPMRLMDGSVVGFIGYTNEDDGEKDDNGFIKYLYPPKRVIAKEKYMYITREEFKKAIEDEYVCIVDGLFDKRRLQLVGINALSLCGSALTESHKRYLSFIKHKVVISDNDSAGLKLAKVCSYNLKGCITLSQGEEWDIDDFLKTKEHINQVVNCIEDMKLEGFLLSKIIKHRLCRSDRNETEEFKE